MAPALSERMLEALRWPDPITPSEWADRNRVLDPRTSREAGPWHTSRVPYAREWMDSAAAWWVRRVTIAKSTQLGGSESLLNVLAWAIAEDPGPTIFVMPTREEGEQYCNIRVAPMVELCPALRAKLGEDRSDSKARMLRFDRCHVLFRTARVASDLSQLSMRWLFGDEVEQWPTDADGEGSPWALALERLRTFSDISKAWMTSTAGLPGGLLDREFNDGDRRRFHLPCPKCGHYQALAWERVRWPADVDDAAAMRARPSDAYYECTNEKCLHHWDDGDKLAALQHGEWIPDGKDPQWWIANRAEVDRAPHRSYHVWAAYSPWLTWHELVEKWLETKHSQDPRAKAVWFNKWLAVPWQETVIETSDHELRACCRDYNRGVVPPWVQWITAGVDTQEYFLPFSVRGWSTNMQSALIDCGRADSFEALEDLLFRRDWSGGDPRRSHLVVSLVVVDARWREYEVIEFARRWGSELVKVQKASDYKGDALFTMKMIEKHPVTGLRLEHGVQMYGLNTDAYKSRLARGIHLAADGQSDGAFTLPRDVDERYVHEMTAEHYILDNSGREPRMRWQLKPHRRGNHFWDCEVLNYAAANIARIDAIRSELAREHNEAERAQQAAPPPPPRRRPRDRDEGDDGPALWHPH